MRKECSDAQMAANRLLQGYIYRDVGEKTWKEEWTKDLFSWKKDIEARECEDNISWKHPAKTSLSMSKLWRSCPFLKIKQKKGRGKETELGSSEIPDTNFWATELKVYM